MLVEKEKFSITDWESRISDSWQEKRIILAVERKVPYENFVKVLESIQRVQPKSLELGLKEK